jgi:RecG-like helicase
MLKTVFSTSMFTLKDAVSSTMLAKLEKEGFYSLYDVLTYFPYKIHTILPFSPSHIKEDGTLMIAEGVVENFQMVYKKRPYITLTLRTNMGDISCYCFQYAPYMQTLFKKKPTIQTLLQRKNGFLSVVRFTEKKQDLRETFSLGYIDPFKTYLEPRYGKKGVLTHTLIASVHNKLPRAAYTISLQDLAPENAVFPLDIDLAAIHHPTTIIEYNKVHKDYIKMRVFLRIAREMYAQQNYEKKLGIASTIHVDFLKNIANLLPYTLSVSQKTTIWDMVQSLAPAIDGKSV